MPTLTLQPAEAAALDTYLESGANANTNFGGAAILNIGNNAFGGIINNILLEFDVSALPASATIVSATLTLKQSAGAAAGGVNMECRRLDELGWVENLATYNRYDGLANWPGGAGGAGDTTGGAFATVWHPPGAGSTVDIDVLVIIRDAFANRAGRALLHHRQTSPAGIGTTYSFHSSSAVNAADRPKLAIAYTVPELPTASSDDYTPACAHVTAGGFRRSRFNWRRHC